MDWQGVPFPPPPRPPRQQVNWPAIGCVLCAISAAWMVWAMIWIGERMVDAVLAITWPV